MWNDFVGFLQLVSGPATPVQTCFLDPLVVSLLEDSPYSKTTGNSQTQC